jgi:hypothetical protein
MADNELIKKLDRRISDLEMQMGKPKKEKKIRKPSEFNIHMKKYLATHKDPSKTHKELFLEATKAWSAQK